MIGYRETAFLPYLAAAIAIGLVACSTSGGGARSHSSAASGPGSPEETSAGAHAGYSAAVKNVINPSNKPGGTLNLVSSGDCDSWDPGRTYVGWCWNMQRLLTRSLVGYSKLNGDKYTLAPDLATSLGQHNQSYTRWSYTLKSGLKFSSGQPIRPIDVKYGIERLFATDVINGGPSSYFIDWIAHPKNYDGPYKSGDLSTITTTHRTITFNLSTPNADWDYLMAMPASAPVPYKVEGGEHFKGATYTKHPVSSGPFMVGSYQQTKQMMLVRNPNWSQSTDTIHRALVDRVVLTVDTNPDDIDQKLQSGLADARADGGVGITFQSKILANPELKVHTDDAGGPLTLFVGIMPSVIPNIHCRRAIFYAFDKAGALRALGGPIHGLVAGSMTPPGVEGYTPSYNPYPTGPENTGDPMMAKAELNQCGMPNGFSTKFAYLTPNSSAANIFKAEQAALAKVKIVITAVTQDQSNYYSNFVGSPANIKSQGIGMAYLGWSPDFPTGIGFYNSIANGANILPTGNSNYASLNDPVVNKILNDAPKGRTSEADWQKLDRQIMKDAVYLPYAWSKGLYYRNPRMTNVTCDNALAYGIYDFVNIGVKD